MNKFVTFILWLLCGAVLVYIFSLLIENNTGEKDTALAWNTFDHITLLAEMENRMSQDEPEEGLMIEVGYSRDLVSEDPRKSSKNPDGILPCGHPSAESMTGGPTVTEEPNTSQTVTDELPDYTKLFPDLYTEYELPTNMEEEKKIAYLTFDDGPSENTFEILDILEELNIRATFFIVGSSITEENEISLKRMKNEGHIIGIHTYSHICNEIYCSVERYLDDFNLVYQQIYDITGERANIYRFPWGSNNPYSKSIKDALMAEMERRGFNCFDWNVDAKDSVGRPTYYSIRHNIEKGLKNQKYPIILMHDSMKSDLTVRSLPDIIGMVRDKGYEFDTLDHREPYQFHW